MTKFLTINPVNVPVVISQRFYPFKVRQELLFFNPILGIN